jgi:hypothetical protein
MTHSWTLRLQAKYEGDKNHVTALSVEQKDDQGAFKPLNIDNQSAGFLIFVYSIFSCQHLYMYTNAAERGLLLDTATGTLDLVATEDWMLSELSVSFEGKLRSGTPNEPQIKEIEARMNQCPVSRNIHPAKLHESKLTLRA